ncbi:MAG: hypothetical protein R3B47_01025 [Bacteroidia bacterium]
MEVATGTFGKKRRLSLYVGPGKCLLLESGFSGQNLWQQTPKYTAKAPVSGLAGQCSNFEIKNRAAPQIFKKKKQSLYIGVLLYILVTHDQIDIRAWRFHRESGGAFFVSLRRDF